MKTFKTSLFLMLLALSWMLVSKSGLALEGVPATLRGAPFTHPDARVNKSEAWRQRPIHYRGKNLDVQGKKNAPRMVVYHVAMHAFDHKGPTFFHRAGHTVLDVHGFLANTPY